MQAEKLNTITRNMEQCFSAFERNKDPEKMKHLAGQYFLNSDLREEEIREQIRELCKVGYEVIFLHARAGLKTPYLSECWFKALDAAVDELIACGAEFAIWDEDNYPSGDAGNRICNEYPELASSYLEFHTTQAEAGKEVIPFFSVNGAFVGCFAVYDDGTLRNLKPYCGTLRPTWDKRSRIQSSAYSEFAQLPYPHRRRAMSPPRFAAAWTPDRNCRIVCVESIRSTPGNHSSDLLNRQTAEQLLKLTHDEYERYFKDKMQYCSASFMDEPSPRGDCPWTRALPEEFFKDHGYEITDFLPHLVLNISEKSFRIRNDYRKTLHRLLCQNYLETVKNHLNKRNISSVGHLTRSESLSCAARYWPNELRCFKYFDIPCCDPLGAGIGQVGAVAHHIGTKLVSSAARLFGKKAAGADAFAVGGDTISLRDLSFMLNYHLTMGITWYNIHGLYYTLDGERRDEAPPSLFYQHSQWDHMKTFLDYLKKRCCELSGTHICDLEMLYPSSTLQSRLLSDPDPSEALHNTAETLLSHHCDFELVDEITLTEQNPDDFVKVRPYFLVAHTAFIEKDAALWLERYVSSGGKLIVTGMIPCILPKIDSENAESWSFAEKYYCDDFCSKLAAADLSGENADAVLIRKICKDDRIRTFMFNRSTNTFRGKFEGKNIEIAAGETGFADELTVKHTLPELQVPLWKLSFAPNCVPLHFWETSSIESFDLLAKNNTGLLPIAESGTYRAVFTVESPLYKVFFTTEEESLARVEFFINDIPLKEYCKADFRDCRELECEITRFLKQGRNIITCRGELMENPPYLRGQFKVNFPYGSCGYPVLSAAPEVFDLTSLRDFRALGYGTFSGKAVYDGTAVVECDGTYSLKLNIVKDSVKVYVDGEEKAVLIAPPYRFDMTLASGIHHIRLELCNAPGNRDIMAGVPAGLQE